MEFPRHYSCPVCSSTNVERRGRPDYSDDKAGVLRCFAGLFGAVGLVLLLVMFCLDPYQRPLLRFESLCLLVLALFCQFGVVIRSARPHARCRSCGCLWRK